MGDSDRGPVEVKPGLRTTEFYQTLFLQVIAAVVAIGTLFGVHFNLDGLQALVPVAALLAAIVSHAVYNWSRTAVKTSAITASSTPTSGGDVETDPDGRGGASGTAAAATPRTPAIGADDDTRLPDAPMNLDDQQYEQILDNISSDLRAIFLRVQLLKAPRSLDSVDSSSTHDRSSV